MSHLRHIFCEQLRYYAEGVRGDFRVERDSAQKRSMQHTNENERASRSWISTRNLTEALINNPKGSCVPRTGG